MSEKKSKKAMKMPENTILKKVLKKPKKKKSKTIHVSEFKRLVLDYHKKLDDNEIELKDIPIDFLLPDHHYTQIRYVEELNSEELNDLETRDRALKFGTSKLVHDLLNAEEQSYCEYASDMIQRRHLEDDLKPFLPLEEKEDKELERVFNISRPDASLAVVFTNEDGSRFMIGEQGVDFIKEHTHEFDEHSVFTNKETSTISLVNGEHHKYSEWIDECSLEVIRFEGKIDLPRICKKLYKDE